MSPSYPSRTRNFLPQLEGLRGVAAIGVLLTHTAFQTGVSQSEIAGAILARFDFFVAVFFGLSAFLLWRGNHPGSPLSYFRRRAIRILPAYWACVLLVFAFLPDSFGSGWRTIVTTLTLTQIYPAHSLAGGLTHLWSLSVEVAFYLFLPALVWALRGASKSMRLLCFLGFFALGIGWAAVPWPLDIAGGINFQLFPPSYAPWFAVGLIAAELEGTKITAWRGFNVTWPWWMLALGVTWAAGQPWFGPQGLTHPTPGEFVRKILAGALFGALILLPYAWRTGGAQRSILGSRLLLTLGRWSYSLFLWHLPVLSVVFPLLGIAPFSGHFLLVTVVCFVGSVIVAAVSFTLVEQNLLLTKYRGLERA
ncbi:acyltransferase family protein [Corynebacterium pseudotuberculosis]|uniref:acyltransferase family protein n=1 Tax=Corynebacterium pseudotuberculosis TaxID=1719 RepID=UPI00065DE884|nr:acyltransferase [Corynebacterium pseudotuberculosis]